MPLVLGLLAVLAVTEPPAAFVRCTCTCADEPLVVDVRPTADPYRVAAVPVGRRFAFRAVWLREPGHEVLDLVAYHATKDGNVPLLQVKLPAPLPEAPAASSYGFTGLHQVYEPDLGSELRFWCGWGPP